MGLTDFRFFSNATSNGRRLFCIMYLVLLFTAGSEENCHATEMENYVIYQSIKIKEVDKFIVEGVNLTDFKFRWIFQYMKTKKAIFILGSTEDAGLRLMKINIADKKSILLAEYPEITKWIDLLEAKFYFIFIEKTDDPKFIIIEYTGGNSARNLDQREKYIVVLRPDNEKQYQLMRSEKVSGNNISYVIMTEEKYKFYYLAFDESESGPEVILPARNESVNIHFSDCNWDGYPDIVIWKTVSLSRLIKDKDKEDFIYDHEELKSTEFSIK